MQNLLAGCSPDVGWSGLHHLKKPWLARASASKVGYSPNWQVGADCWWEASAPPHMGLSTSCLMSVLMRCWLACEWPGRMKATWPLLGSQHHFHVLFIWNNHYVRPTFLGRIRLHLLKGGMSKNVWTYLKTTMFCNSILFLYTVLLPFLYPLYRQENWDLEKLAGIPKLHSFCSVTEPRLKPRFSDSLSSVLSAVPWVYVY